MNTARTALFVVIAASLTGCQSMKTQPYTPAQKGVVISGNQSTGYVVNSVSLSQNNVQATPDALVFCFGQNIPGMNGSPLLNPSQTRITAQGSDQVSFIVPMTMGTPLNFDLSFTVTSEIKQSTLDFNFRNLKIKGTWNANENPLPGSQEAHLYVNGALEKFKNISEQVSNCVRYET
tara:strand:+ start:468 stop:998 length:531 start_codon:yes stop_codon:yes gene_type:complete